MHLTTLLAADDISELAGRVGIDAIMDGIIEGFAEACRQFDPAACEIPPRTGFHYDQPFPGLVEWMPLMMHGDRILMKMVGYHPENPAAHDLPTILCTLALFDSRTGHLLAIADGTLLTAMRTGAASAVATGLLANPESRTLGLIGAGAQAITQLHAISRLYPLENVLLYDTDPARTEDFAARATSLGLSKVALEATSLENLLAQSDIISTATSVEPGKGPVFSSALPTKPWLHINAVGSDFPGKIEVPREHLEKSFVCPDFREQVEREGECQQLEDHHIGPELLDLAKDPSAYAAYQQSLSVFDSTGFALEDHVALTLLLDLATEHNCGSTIRFEDIAADPFDPYEFLKTN